MNWGEYLLDKSPGLIRVLAWVVLVPVAWAIFPLTWLVLPKKTFDRFWS
jgi:hypothetical protein